MARRLIRRFLPDTERIRTHRGLRLLGARRQQSPLWRLNRHSVSKGAALGLFMAFMPLPVQTVPAAVAALYLRANLPVTMTFV